MPHCVLWAESDWSYALDTVLVAAAFHAGSSAAATELRQREKVLGTTIDARRGLRIRYVGADSVPDCATPAPASAGLALVDEYRELYGG